MSEIVKGILRAVSSGLQIPTIIILILLILLTILMLGSFFAELFTERRALKMNIPKLVDQLQGKSTSEMKEVIEKSSLLTRQKAAAQELISRVTYPDDTREALARQLIADEEMRYGKIVKITDLIARVAPMFGLMGTLIPLGPGLIALGQGDTKTLSDSILIAFDTTVAGLISGAISYIVSGLRKGWYEEYMIGLETIMETILDVQTTERRKAAQQKKTADAAKAQTQQQTGAAQQKARNAAQQQTARTTAQARPTAQQQTARTAAQQQAARTATQAQPGAAQVRTAAQQQAARAAAQAQRQAQQTVSRNTAPMPAVGQPERAAQINKRPSYVDANSKTIAGPAAARLQEEIRAAERALNLNDLEAGMALEEEKIRSMDDILESFSPREGRR